MTATQPTHELFRPPRMLGMTAWHIWTHQARAVNRRGLRTQKTRLQRLCREVFAQTMGAEFAILMHIHFLFLKVLAHTAGRLAA